MIPSFKDNPEGFVAAIFGIPQQLGVETMAYTHDDAPPDADRLASEALEAAHGRAEIRPEVRQSPSSVSG